MRHLTFGMLVATAVLAAGTPAAAIAVKPLADARLRYEHASQDGLANDADALTIRARAGLAAQEGPFTALVEAQGMFAVVGDYDDGLSGAATRPLVADPENVALSRAQLQYKAKGVTLTAGRQRILLDDERFVGGVGFRQNGQSFDAVRAELTPMKGVKLDAAYVWRVQTIWGIEGNGARPRSIPGDTILAGLSCVTPFGTLSGFGYFLDMDMAALQSFRLSSKTFGARLAGGAPVGKARLGWQLNHARQQDHGRNPNDYQASYWLADLSLDLNGPKLGVGYEVLGADDGRALTSFQMPLGTNFKFQGWADKFLTTPPDGVRDLYASAGWGWKRIGKARAVQVQAVYHRFDADRNSRRYGDEWNLLASARLGRTTASARFADYRASSFATDTQKFWLQLDWTL